MVGDACRVRTEERLELLEEILDGKPGTPPTGAAGRAFDREMAVERLGGDEKLFTEAVGLFLAEIPSALCRVREAVRRSDAKGLAEAAHGMRGMASSFEATALVAEARRLELLGNDGDLAGARGALPEVEREAARLVTELVDLATS